MGKDSNLLYSNGDSLVLTKDLARNILNKMGMVRRRGNTKAKCQWKFLIKLRKGLFLLYVKNTALMNEIPT